MSLFFRAKPATGAGLLRWGTLGVSGTTAPPVYYPPSFDEFLTWPERTDILVAMVQPGELLREWTATAHPFLYFRSYPSFIATEDIAGGLYRSLVEVWEGNGDNDIKLQKADSLIQVTAVPGSYFVGPADDGSQVIYLHTTDGASPEDKDAIMGFFNIYFSTHAVTLTVDGIPVPMAPFLEDQTSVTMQQTAEDPLFGIKRIQTGSISIINVNGFFSRLYARYYWKNKNVSIFIGGCYNKGCLDFPDYRQLGTWLISDVGPQEDVATIKLVSQTSVLELKVPVTPYTPDIYPDAASGVIGSFKPLWYGKTTVQPDLIDSTSLGIYLLADPQFQTMFSVDAVFGISRTTGQRVGLQASDYIVSLSACTLTITNPAFDQKNWAIEVTATGKPDNAGGYIHTWADIAYDLLTAFAGQLPENFDLVSRDNANVAASHELSLYIKQQRDLLSIFQSGSSEACLERSVMSRLDTTRDGRWQFKVWSQPIQNVSPTLILNQQDFMSFVPQPKLTSVFYKVIVLYDFNHSKQEWQSVSAFSNRSRYANTTEDVVFIYTNLKNVSDATILAQRYRYLWSVVPLEIQCVERGIQSLDLRLHDLVMINYSPAPSPSKAFVNTLFAVTDIQQTFSKPPQFSFVLNNIRSSPGNIGFWMSPSAPNWSNSSPQQRASQGFWTDPLGRTDPNDLGSVGKSLWW